MMELNERNKSKEQDAGDPGAFLTVEDLRARNYVSPKKKKVTFSQHLPQNARKRGLLSTQSITVLSYLWLVISLVCAALSYHEVMEPWETATFRCEGGTCVHAYKDPAGVPVKVEYAVEDIQDPRLCRFHREVGILRDNAHYQDLPSSMQRRVFWNFCISVALPHDDDHTDTEPEIEALDVQLSPFQTTRRKARENIESLQGFLEGKQDLLEIKMHAPWKTWAVGMTILSYASIIFLVFFGEFKPTREKKS
mmetsp:Transcript_9534/g.12463  ORF Transcript_9534/g.12463 Transcript_9534/m.12463 type:complete len:251 (+) Transcript_9534:32-784(+)